ncbi:MAG TPA: FtsX-like permease family protein, partial [Elusimicrobiota bacterium]|nr:FtsX-like permease family protein [Elusimicrobiota bacterium]
RSMLEHARKQAAEALFIGLIAILAGGVGIMNVTLAAVFARVREIGIRRALGATRADILLQFVLEASLLGLLGGVAGLALGVGGIVGLAENADAQLRGLQAWHFLAALGIAAGAGFLFSLYPAYQASNLDPLEALRCE